MYNDLTPQSLPDENYLKLLGTAICCFNSNNGFIIENILRNDTKGEYNWYDLIDRTSGRLTAPIQKCITEHSDKEIADLFSDLVDQRNRIIHSFRITSPAGTQILATKEPNTHKQFHITEEYLQDFIKKNGQLSSLLHKFSGY